MDETKTIQRKKFKFSMPDSLVMIILVMIIAAILTFIIPAGSYERVKLENGRTTVVADSFTFAEKQSGVNPLTVLTYVFQGLTNGSSIIFPILVVGGAITLILSTGMFHAIAGSMVKRLRGKGQIMIAGIMLVFALLCIPCQINNFIPFATLGVVLSLAMGYDSIVGMAMILLGGSIGVSCGAMNLGSTMAAQAIAELPTFSGAWYRLICMIPFYLVSLWYVLRYAKRVKNDPTKSLVYGIDMEEFTSDSNEMPTFTKKHIPATIVFALGLIWLIYLAVVKQNLSGASLSFVFLYTALCAGIVSRKSIGDMSKTFLNGVKNMAPTAMMIGFAYCITIIMTEGNIMDTVVFYGSKALDAVPDLLKAPAMFIFQCIVNIFISAGAGQATATMGVIIPISDLVGITRQTAVLAFNLGSGFCDLIIPHAAATLGFCGLAKVPFSKWFKFMIKLFAFYLIVGIVMMIIATLINYS